MVLQIQLVNAIWRELFGSLQSFHDLAMGMMVASSQEGGNYSFPNIV